MQLRLRRDKTIPILFHNGSRYDFHLFVKDLGKIAGGISVIAKNEEQHISIDKKIPTGEKSFWKLQFPDSCGFLQAPLDELVKNSVREDFKTIFEKFGEEKSELLLRKGVFLYEWFDDIEKLNETQLPPIEAFFSTLKGEGISEEDYEHAKKVWDVFGMKIMRDYHDLYCMVDVLQLCDVFEYQRTRLIKSHGLGLLHFFTLPGFSWQAAMKYTGQMLELIFDREIYDFDQSAMRRGTGQHGNYEARES